MDHVLTEAVKTKFVALDPLFDERLRRRWAAVEAHQMGRGGIACGAAATGMSRTTIRAGLKELVARQAPDADAGRKRLTTRDPKLARAVERLVDPGPAATRWGRCCGPVAVRRRWRANCQPPGIP